MPDFTLLVLEGALPSAVAVSRDILSTAAQLAPLIGVARPAWAVYSWRGGAVRLQDGFTVATQRLPARGGSDESVWIVPGLGVADPDALSKRLDEADAVALASRLAAHVRRGGNVAASCASVFLLARAGLLSQRRVTTSWWLASHLSRLAPDAEVDAHHLLRSHGPITTAGAALAHTDLMLHLLRKHCGTRLADRVARMLLIDGRQAQAPYIVPKVLAGGDELVARLTARVEAGLPDAPSVAALAAELHMSEKTLSRHVMRATGASTRSLLRHIRVHRARALLENSRMSIEAIAAAVGYQDATALRRLMHQVAGASPSRFRRATLIEPAQRGPRTRATRDAARSRKHTPQGR